MAYGLSWLACHGIWNGLVGMAWYVIWPDGHDIVYGIAWRAWYGERYGLEGMAQYMVWPDDAWHGIWYILVGMACYMVWLGGHGMAYGMAWRA